MASAALFPLAPAIAFNDLPPDLLAFRSRLCTLRHLDMHEVEAFGMDRDRARFFVANPVEFFIKAGDHEKAAIWSAMQRWAPKAVA